jgi:hypothetical protein
MTLIQLVRFRRFLGLLPAGRDKALARGLAKAGSRLMPDSHNAVKQTG